LNRSYVNKITLTFFLSAPKGAVAIARYYFYSVTGAVAPLLNLTNSGSDAINKVGLPISAITSQVGYVDKGSLWKPNILPLFNLGWWYL